MFGGSEFITGGGCGCADGGDVKHGGGLFEDLRPTKGIASIYPRNWTVHGAAAALMLLSILLLIIWMFMPDADNALAISAGVFALFYLVVEILSVTPYVKDYVNNSFNSSAAAKAASSLTNAVADTTMSLPIMQPTEN